MTITTELVQWAWGLQLDDVPEHVQVRVAGHLLDGVGTAIAAGRIGAGHAACSVALALGGPPESTVLGMRTAVAAPAAALATGTLVHALDFDDTHAGGLVHATAVVLPAALAVGELHMASGHDVLAAAVAGYETVCRIARAAPHAFHARGLHATAMCGVFSAALVAARLGGLTAQGAVNALGIAGSQAGGLLEALRTGAATKQLHPGLASQSGVLAARLAAAGAEGPATVLEGKYGFYPSLAAREVTPDAVLGGLGTDWESSRISIKPYPACQLTHAALDAATDALRQIGRATLTPGDVAEAVVELHQDSSAIVAEPAVEKVRPRTSYEAKFSVQWTVAALLLDGEVTIDTYASASINRHDIAALAIRIRTIAVSSPGLAADAPGRVILRLADGREFTGTVGSSAGEPHRPLDRDALLVKAISNAGGSSPLMTELTTRLQGLAGEPDLRRVVHLADVLASPGAGPSQTE